MNESIPIFDSLTHPTMNSHWISSNTPHCCDVDLMLKQMELNNIQWAFSVGIKGIGAYDEETFIQFIQEKGKDKLFPIAFFDLTDSMNKKSIINSLTIIKKLGYRGIKLHPRISNFILTHKFLPAVIDLANELNLVVLLCSYFYDNKPKSYLNNMDNLILLFSKIHAHSKLILLHGGGIHILETMEIARAFENIIIDLSFTLCKYAGSSIDLDIQYLFHNFDRRICIGSDFPEFKMQNLRERFALFSKAIPSHKAENIAYKNLLGILES